MRGSCNCGAVRFETRGNVWSATACHCGQCRKQSGGVWHSVVTKCADLEIDGPVQWYRSSPVAQRGFCPTCGSFLFWSFDTEASISISLGAVDAPTGITLEKHIFVGSKGDYYDIADGLPQEETE